jgi:hypothetical protein
MAQAALREPTHLEEALLDDVEVAFLDVVEKALDTLDVEWPEGPPPSTVEVALALLGGIEDLRPGPWVELCSRLRAAYLSDCIGETAGSC